TEATADTATDTFTTDTLEAFTTLDTTGAAAELAGLEVDAVVEAATIFGVAAHRVATDPSCRVAEIEDDVGVVGRTVALDAFTDGAVGVRFTGELFDADR